MTLNSIKQSHRPSETNILILILRHVELNFNYRTFHEAQKLNLQTL